MHLFTGKQHKDNRYQHGKSGFVKSLGLLGSVSVETNISYTRSWCLAAKFVHLYPGVK